MKSIKPTTTKPRIPTILSLDALRSVAGGYEPIVFRKRIDKTTLTAE